MNNKILVTGSNGFIGSHVAKYLKDRDYYVIGLGRSNHPFDESSVNEYVQCDLGTDKVYRIPSLLSEKVDAVIHLAADMRKEPHCVEVISANCCGTQRLLEMCESNGIETFIQLSSLPVIGHPCVHPITESHPISPYTVYHITKRTEELLANYACEYHDIRTSSFRISAPIGPRVNPNTIFPTFIRNSLKNKDLILMGKGTRKQNYLYVKDLARCLELALLSEKVHGIYNLTSNLLISNLELAEKIIRVLDSKSKIVLQGEDPMDNYVWDASIQKIQLDAGYEPKSSIEDIIVEYAGWLMENDMNRGNY